MVEVVLQYPDLDDLILEGKIHPKKAGKIRRMGRFRDLDNIENIIERYTKKGLLAVTGCFTVGGMRQSSQEAICDYLGIRRKNFFTLSNLFIDAPLKVMGFLGANKLVSESIELLINNPETIQKYTKVFALTVGGYGALVWGIRVIYTFKTDKPIFSPTFSGIFSEGAYLFIKNYNKLKEAYVEFMKNTLNEGCYPEYYLKA